MPRNPSRLGESTQGAGPRATQRRTHLVPTTALSLPTLPGPLRPRRGPVQALRLLLPQVPAHPVPRFRCSACGRTFSRQTFRADYYDHKPHLNAPLLINLISGVGLRQSSRTLNLTRRCTELKARKIARHLRRLNLNLRGVFDRDLELQLDELETYESRRRERPVTFPIAIDAKSRFIIWGESAKLSPRGRMTPARRRAVAADEARFGKRRDRSRVAVRRTLQRVGPMIEGLGRVPIQTDQKSGYPGLIRRTLGIGRTIHNRTSSRAPRTISNPLFPINQTEAMARDNLGRLRRESWLISKNRRYLDLAFHIFMAWRNYVRPRFNRDALTPAQIAGFVPRRLRLGELIGWRQDWGNSSIPVLALCGR